MCKASGIDPEALPSNLRTLMTPELGSAGFVQTVGKENEYGEGPHRARGLARRVISGPNDGPAAPMGAGGERLLAWYAGGDTDYRTPGTDMVFKVAAPTAEAQAVAGDKDVGVGAASIVQQCIRAGLLDEIHIDLVPVLLGGGVSLFDHLGTGPIDLEITRVIEGAGVTHLTFRVLK